MRKILAAVITVWGFCFLVSCGVKGDPIAPGVPPKIGEGRPLYQRPADRANFPEIPPVPEVQSIQEDEAEE